MLPVLDSCSARRWRTRKMCLAGSAPADAPPADAVTAPSRPLQRRTRRALRLAPDAPSIRLALRPPPARRRTLPLLHPARPPDGSAAQTGSAAFAPLPALRRSRQCRSVRAKRVPLRSSSLLRAPDTEAAAPVAAPAHHPAPESSRATPSGEKRTTTKGVFGPFRSAS